MWKRQKNLNELNAMSGNSMIGHIGIEFTAINSDSIEATMPVDCRTMQPFGLLHGGASVTLAETLGSVAGYLCSQGDDKVVGLEINTSHLYAARSGQVKGVCQPLRVGRSHQVWEIKIYDDYNNLCSISRLTTAVLSAGHKSTS